MSYQRPFRNALLSVLALAIAGQASAQDTLDVNGDLSGGADDGSTWADAFRGDLALPRALQAAGLGDRVFVAQGTYKATNTLDRTATFDMPSGARVYGGILGSETSPFERPSRDKASTFLSGDLLGNDVFTSSSLADNSFQVVRVGSAAINVTLDGFFVVGGIATRTRGIRTIEMVGAVCTSRRLLALWCKTASFPKPSEAVIS